MSTQLELDLNPRKVVQSLDEMGLHARKLEGEIEEALGKNAAKSVAKLEEAAEKGTTRIQTFFRNLGTRVKEDLKTAFDATGVLAGAKFAKDISEGAKQVFEMERAFDRLNTRLRMSGQELEKFKKNLGRNVAATGQSLESVMPGVETAAAKGGVKSPDQLAAIGSALGQARATTGEETGSLSDTIVEILKTQGKQITDKTFRDTLDALEGTRTHGAFKSAQEAGGAIEQLSPYAKQFGMSTRQMGGLAATASRSGSAGQDILRQLMEQASHPGGMDKLNSVLGANIFKNGKLDASQIGKINTNKYGQYSQQTMEAATGLTGASGADLTRFVDAFKGGMGDFSEVIKGSNETASQFAMATDNLASGMDRFKERTQEAGREIGESLSKIGNDILHGEGGKLVHDTLGLGKNIHENKGTLLAATGITAAVGILAGGGLKGLLSRAGGGDMAKGLLKGQLAKAAGVNPVYVTNAAEIGKESGSGLNDFINKSGGLMGTAGTMEKMGRLGKIAGGAGKALGAVGAAAGAFEMGMAIGDALMQVPAFQKMADAMTAMVAKAVQPSDKEALDAGGKQGMSNYLNSPAHKAALAAGHGLTPDALAAAVEKGTVAAHEKTKGKAPHTNPSAVSGREAY